MADPHRPHLDKVVDLQVVSWSTGSKFNRKVEGHMPARSLRIATGVTATTPLCSL